MAHYAVLGLLTTATKEEIISKYRKLSLEHHPDKNGNAAIFQAINEARDVLTNEAERAAYDQGGQDAVNMLRNQKNNAESQAYEEQLLAEQARAAQHAQEVAQAQAAANATAIAEERRAKRKLNEQNKLKDYCNAGVKDSARSPLGKKSRRG